MTCPLQLFPCIETGPSPCENPWSDHVICTRRWYGVYPQLTGWVVLEKFFRNQGVINTSGDIAVLCLCLLWRGFVLYYLYFCFLTMCILKVYTCSNHYVVEPMCHWYHLGINIFTVSEKEGCKLFPPGSLLFRVNPPKNAIQYLSNHIEGTFDL
jgi:hypothetical protein